MASIKDALDEVINDDHSFIKLVVYTIPVCISYMLFSIGNMGWFYFTAGITTIILLTLLIKTINNVRNGENYVLPDWNIFSFGISAFKSIFAVMPISGLCVWAGLKLTQIQIPIPVQNIQLIYSIIVWLILGSIMITSLILYSKTEKIKDAYNFSLISETCIDMLLGIIFYSVQLIVLDVIFIGTFAYLFSLFWHLNNPVFIFICCFAIPSSIAITGNYLAQMDYEIVAREENN